MRETTRLLIFFRTENKMAKNNKNKRSVDEAVRASHRKANIVVGVVVGVTVLILIAIAVLCLVRVDPMDGIAAPDAAKGEYYDLYDLDSEDRMRTDAKTQSKIRTALGNMQFSVMNAILQWNWDYSYNFVRNGSGGKIKMSADEVTELHASSNAYMVEYVYADATENGELVKSKARSLEVDGETIYFDRLKVLIGNTDDSVGEIYMYPYVYELATNKAADGGITQKKYNITPIKVRANTTETYKALENIIAELNRG